MQLVTPSSSLLPISPEVMPMDQQVEEIEVEVLVQLVKDSQGFIH